MKSLFIGMAVIIGLAAAMPQRASAQTFNDVPPNYWAFSFIETFAANGITSGCGNDNYCPEGLVTRAQMAIFLERGMRGSNYSPPPATGNVFFDVGLGSFGAAFIEQFFRDGITSGCGGGNYCPGSSVTRAQMAVFLLRAKHGANFSPPPATGDFNDVGVNDFAANFIEQLAFEGITSGCGNNNYCPGDPVTRAQMAVFIVRTFDLGGGGPDLTISTNAGPFGSFAPESKTVPAGSTGHEFVVTPDAGFRYDSVTGCSGLLDGNTYITGQINANCTITATFAPIEDLTVLPLYSNNGANWNDYVLSAVGSAIDLPCTFGSAECQHGGEQRVVVVSGKTSCDDLAMDEELDAFDWQCRINSGGVAEFVSTGLADGMHLSDLLDFNSAAFRSNSVTVHFNGSVYGLGVNSIHTTWNNTVSFAIPNVGGTTFLSDASSIYVLTNFELNRPGVNSEGKFVFNANKVGLVIEPGATLKGPSGGGNQSYVIESTGEDFLWLEGSIDAAQNEVGVRMQGASFSTLRNVTANNANDGNNSNTSVDVGIFLDGSSKNRLEWVTANDNFIYGIYFSASSNNTLMTATANSNDQTGVELRGSSQNNTLLDVTANNNFDTGVRLTSGSMFNAFQDLTVSGNRSGVAVDTAAQNSLSNVTATGNTSSGVSLFIADNNTFTFVNATGNGSGNNNQGGITLVGASNNMFSNVTASSNDAVGLSLTVNEDNQGTDNYSDSNTFTTVTALNNLSTDILLEDSADNTFGGVDAFICSVGLVVGNESPRPSTNPGLDSNCNPVP